jgi:hypothetical protein
VLSWIFLHRARLQVIYGRVAPPPLAGERFAGDAGPATVASRQRGGRDARPGELWRNGRVIALRPMPRRVG